MIRLATVFSGIGAIEHALDRMQLDHKIVFACDNGDVDCFPADVIEERTGRMNYSLGDDGEVDHWHIVFFRDVTGHMTQLLSHPELEEIDLDDFKI